MGSHISSSNVGGNVRAVLIKHDKCGGRMEKVISDVSLPELLYCKYAATSH